MQVAAVIFLGIAARLAIVAALHNMQWNIIEVEACAAGHS
jgi:hypothetical protein